MLNKQIDVIINVLRYSNGNKLPICKMSSILTNITNEVILPIDLIRIVEAQNILQKQGYRLNLEIETLSGVKEQFVILENYLV